MPNSQTMSESAQSIFSVVLGTVLLCYVVYAKWSEYRFRRTAIRVQGKVLKVFPHRHSTSYFLSYEIEGLTRSTEYCGMPLLREFEPGDTVEILIDPNDPPDSEVPETTHNAPGRGVGGGNCVRAGSSIFRLWDGIYIFASIALIVYALR